MVHYEHKNRVGSLHQIYGHGVNSFLESMAPGNMMNENCISKMNFDPKDFIYRTGAAPR